ncbi:MAG: prephenate dehydrogenase/arogenate dehydrogenase family protein [Candidatus Bathyarchaeota archaeon]|nr:prephenate dehydrogenase/arogenate dehydrogenase family protein [Candidatus Bathyarchaeota archaeon]
MRLAVIGAGKMGVWFARFFQKEGYSVVVADRKRDKLEKLRSELGVEIADFAEAARNADRVLICVSISAFEEVVEKISPVIREGQVVMDICSVKELPVNVMHKHLPAALVLGTHPVFGPGSTSIENKTFVLTPTSSQEEAFAADFKKWLEERKARVLIMSPRKHDELMSVVLGMPHFLGLVACDTLLEQANYAETKQVAGTTYRLLYTLAEVAAAETPELFTSLQLTLPGLEQLEDVFIKKANEWLKIIKDKDQKAISRKMEQLKAKLAEKGLDYARTYELMYKMLEATEK